MPGVCRVVMCIAGEICTTLSRQKPRCYCNILSEFPSAQEGGLLELCVISTIIQLSVISTPQFTISPFIR